MENLLEEFRRREVVPSTIRRMLSSEVTDAFWEIMTRDEYFEPDLLLLTGQMTDSQFQQYIVSTGIHDQMLYELTKVAISLRDVFRRKLPDLLRCEARDVLRKDGLEKFISAVFRLVVYRDAYTDTYIPYLMDCFLSDAFALIGLEMYEILDRDELTLQDRRILSATLKKLNDFFDEKYRTDFIGKQLYSEKKFYCATLGNPINIAALDRVIGFKGSFSEDEKRRIDQEIAESLAVIVEEVVYKTIPQITLSSSCPKIVFAQRDADSGNYYSTIGAVIIHFGSEDVTFPSMQEDHQGGIFCDYGIRDHVINLTIDPVSGDLRFVTMNLPLSSIFSADRYRALQYFILTNLYNYLADKEPDIEDLFVVTPKREEKLCFRESTGDSSIVSGENLSLSGCSFSIDTTQGDSIKQEGGDDSSQSCYCVLSKHQRGVILSKIRSASPREIHTALEVLFGPPERMSGSHRSYNSTRTKVTLSVPFHSRREKSRVALGLILQHLKTWGYSTMELFEALGGKI